MFLSFDFAVTINTSRVLGPFDTFSEVRAVLTCAAFKSCITLVDFNAAAHPYDIATKSNPIVDLSYAL